jgi:hypothetical protein
MQMQMQMQEANANANANENAEAEAEANANANAGVLRCAQNDRWFRDELKREGQRNNKSNDESGLASSLLAI